ncbi:hypothetical protein ACFQU9_19760 [Actinomadura namibiensis]|uniref:hypothetical protein n=1 Tax=Actinomadura kijaniata TaxID=46161 RepID=UPI001C728196
MGHLLAAGGDGRVPDGSRAKRSRRSVSEGTVAPSSARSSAGMGLSGFAGGPVSTSGAMEPGSSQSVLVAFIA